MVGWVVIGFVALVATYTLVMFLIGARRRGDQALFAEHRQFVILIPCLNEELVIGRTIDRLLASMPHNLSVIVIDDGSEDRTAEVMEAYADRRVGVLRRTLPEARQGKGRALNAAYRALRDHVVERRIDPSTVVVGVLDADGRFDVDRLHLVDRAFEPPNIAGVQIRVRIHNAPDGLLPRLQDVEFATFTEVFQRARAMLGSAGLGGNGQFARLSALMELGDEPWSDCLTEDLELGINFMLAGWRNEFLPSVAVSQQGVTDVGRLVKQRSRWFQGHLQCLPLLARIARSDRMPLVARLDVAYHLLNSVLMLVFQTLALVWLAVTAVLLTTRPVNTDLTVGGWVVLYLLGFGLAPLIAVAYRRARPEVGMVRCVLLAHLYVMYTYLWWFAGLSAVFHHVRGDRAWAKTARTAGTGDEPVVVRQVLPFPMIDLTVLPTVGSAAASAEGPRQKVVA